MNKIWLSTPHLSGHEQKYVQQAFESNWIAPLGPNVDGFENDLCQYVGAPHAAALASGTAAIHLALVMLGVGLGDAVICQSCTFAASANPIVYQGATPVFVDSETDTWNICPDALETAIKSERAKGKNIKAVIVVHLYGMPAKMREITDICTRYDIPLIEDAAEALGSSYEGQRLGSFGTMGVLSFNGNKIITTSGGGALLAHDEHWITQAKKLATQAREDAPHYQHEMIGYNYRLSNVCAGIGRGQMKVIDERVAQRRANFAYYQKAFDDIEGIDLQPEMSGSFSNRWLTAIIVNPALCNGKTREDIRLLLATQNIEARPLWKPMHLQPVFADAPYYGANVSGKLFEDGLCLPSGSDLREESLARVVTAIKCSIA
jgi:dTDP-4-amino-4,6-dideoxygalactose transaminase